MSMETDDAGHNSYSFALILSARMGYEATGATKPWSELTPEQVRKWMTVAIAWSRAEEATSPQPTREVATGVQ